MDWEAEGLLDGVEGEAREARASLLDELAEQGVGLDELREAVAEGRLALLPAERTLLGEPRYTAGEVAERSGLDPDILARMRRALGIPVPDPDARAFTEEDLEAARRAKGYLDAGLPLDSLLAVQRVLGDSMARGAEAIRSLFRDAYLHTGDTEADVGHRYGEMADALMPMVAPDLEYLLRTHLRELTRHEAVGFEGGIAGAATDTQEVAVGFADLVGFTRLGEQLSVEELGDVATRLTEIARERILPPVRLVKTIGDAVMLVSTQPAPMVDVMLDLVDAVREAGLPPLRAGIAWGPAVARHGDWYGATVNLASRVAGRARPDSVLVTDSLREALGDDGENYEWSFAGEKRLKNVSAETPVWRVRRAPAGS